MPKKNKVKQVEKKSLVDTVVLQLRDTIERNRMSPGERMPAEPKLVEQLGVSRTVLREATSRLQSIGLLTVRRGFGTCVADQNDLKQCVKLIRTTMTICSRDLIQFLELREAIESKAARHAAELATNEDLKALEAICQKMERKDQDSNEAMRLDLQFHLKLVDITKNKLMLHVLEVLQEFVLEGTLRTMPRRRIVASACICPL